MRVLIAEDDPVSRRALEAALSRWGLEVVACSDGDAAWSLLTSDSADPPKVAILDWEMPGLDGVEVCRRLRQTARRVIPYLILLTGRGATDDAVGALEGGADDFISKPFQPALLHAQIRAGARIVELREKLGERVRELEEALAQVKQLRGLLPICSYCKSVREDKSSWRQIEAYIADHSDAQFSHGVCPDCFKKHVKPAIDGLPARGTSTGP